MIKHCIQAFIVLVIALLTSTVYSTPMMAILDEQNPSVNIGKVGSYFIDESSNLSLRDVDSEALRKRFIPINSSFLQFGLVKGNIWIRVDIAQKLASNTPAVLHIKAPRIQIIDVYTPGLTNNQVYREMGESRPFSSRSISYPDYVVPLPTNVPPLYTLYIKVSSHLPINFLVEVKTLSALSTDIEQDSSMTGVLLGILLLLFACNIFFYIRTHRTMYVMYSILLIGIAMLHLAMHGYIYQLFPNILGLQERVYNFNALICAAAIAYFTRSYINTKEMFPRIDRVLLIVGFLNVALALLFSLAPHELNIAFLSTAVFGTSTFLLCVAIYISGKNVPYAPYYLLARSILTAGHTAWMLSAYGVIPLPFWFEWGLTVSIILEALVHFTGIMTHLTPERRKQNQNEAHAIDSAELLDDVAIRINRQIAVIDHYDNNSANNEHIKRAHANLTYLAEKLSQLHRIRNNAVRSPSFGTLNLQILIEQALTSFQAIDQNNAEVELNHTNVACWELTSNCVLFKHLYQSIMEELKHQTDQVLSVDTLVENNERDNHKNLHIEVHPIPTSLAPLDQNQLGTRYLQEITHHLEGHLSVTGEGRNRKLVFDIPASLNYIEASELAKKTHSEELIIVIVGEDSDEIERSLNQLHSRLFSVTHIDQLGEIHNLLHYRPEGSYFSILLFEDKQNFGTSQLERFKGELIERDTCLLISNDVKMSRDHASNLGFDSYIYSINIETMLIAELERVQKEEKFSLSRINRTFRNR